MYVQVFVFLIILCLVRKKKGGGGYDCDLVIGSVRVWAGL